MGLPDYIQPLDDQLPENLKELLPEEENHRLIATYERSYPDNIQVTTEGQILVKTEENRNLELDPQVVLIAEESVGELDRHTILTAETYRGLFEKSEEVDREEIEDAIKQLYSGFIQPDRNQKPTLHRLKQEIQLGYQKPNCPECGGEIKAESDATEAYCHHCEKTVPVPGTL